MWDRAIPFNVIGYGKDRCGRRALAYPKHLAWPARRHTLHLMKRRTNERALRAGLIPLLAAVLLLASAPARAGIPGSAGLGVDQPPDPIAAPDFTLPTLAGGKTKLSALRGRVVLLHFWASWCPPCREELPQLVAMAAQHKKGMTLLAVDADSSDAKGAARFVAAHSIGLPIALDSHDKVHQDYGIRALPTTYLIDRQGKIVGRIVGARDWNSPAAQRLIKGLLAP